MPAFLVRLFSLFPLRTFPSHDQPTSSSSSLLHPVLYVAPGHSHNTGTSWASADVRSLRWQVEFIFRGASQNIDIKHLPRSEAWGPAHGSLPFLQVPNRKLMTLGEDSILTWAETKWPFDWERVESEPSAAENMISASRPYPSEEMAQEAKTWSSLLERTVFAAVLLVQMSVTPLRRYIPGRPIFSRWLRSYLDSQAKNQDANLIASLTSTESRWTSNIPIAGISLSWIGLGASLSGRVGEGRDDGGGDGYTYWPENLDLEALVQEAVLALAAINSRYVEPGGWFLGAE